MHVTNITACTFHTPATPWRSTTGFRRTKAGANRWRNTVNCPTEVLRRLSARGTGCGGTKARRIFRAHCPRPLPPLHPAEDQDYDNLLQTRRRAQVPTPPHHTSQNNATQGSATAPHLYGVDALLVAGEAVRQVGRREGRLVQTNLSVHRSGHHHLRRVGVGVEGRGRGGVRSTLLRRRACRRRWAVAFAKVQRWYDACLLCIMALA